MFEYSRWMGVVQQGLCGAVEEPETPYHTVIVEPSSRWRYAVQQCMQPPPAMANVECKRRRGVVEAYSALAFPHSQALEHTVTTATSLNAGSGKTARPYLSHLLKQRKTT
jgi:hypothetical protein